MAKLREALLAASRDQLLRAITLAIHGYTVSAREPELSDDARALINNQIHHLAGHLLNLIN
ncbi:MAG: hypothetical protein AAGI28_00725 [Pseudomonadota bacterium]